ncbi:cell division protein FtsX [Prevotella lacticifex]|uniref:Cell division protein FtsX n=1 Tax=Prevotella lacticifex TaxID=2854755 RepID=A0A9R1CAZ1_9BACT|nr:permease-like cell division protein FtsX [Prevotella lacticifex]GJG35953.1 cell division protein FtsX [Prevotella lacticifex]GJG38997.1 cell division protein FtsX [Prevotella lacticifex]GJG42322.1 cell division protein FtsX [Prevotella lacticifex]GJG45352.1 cell division protein FtsX [Prevotella lacticifex]GJG48673.1 cell division protein FtsX [Prevotella lacticifex]
MNKKRKKAGKSRHGLQVATLCISTAMVLILLGMVVLTVFTGVNLSSYVKENLTVTMVLSPDMSDQEAQRLSQLVEQQPYITKTNFISKEDALKEGTKELGADPSEFAGENPFTAEIEIQLKANYANNDSIKNIAAQLKTYDGVTDIDYKQDLIATVNNTLGKIGLILIILAALLTIVSFSLINNSVRLSVYSRRFSIHTMKLVGASWGFIRRPFLKRSVALGLLSAFIALVVLGIGMYALTKYEPDITTIIDWKVMVITGCIVVVFGVVITLICTFLSVNKFLNMKAGDLYKI